MCASLDDRVDLCLATKQLDDALPWIGLVCLANPS